MNRDRPVPSDLDMVAISSSLHGWGGRPSDPLLSEHTRIQLEAGNGHHWFAAGDAGFVLTLVPDVTGRLGIAEMAGPGNLPAHWLDEFAAIAGKAGFQHVEAFQRGGASKWPVQAKEIGSVVRLSRSLELVEPELGRDPMLPADRPGILEVLELAFAGHPENGSWSDSELQKRFDSSWYDPRGLLVEREGSTVYGLCWLKIHEDGVGEIYLLAVHPDHSGGGIGRRLAEQGLRHLAATAGAGVAIVYTEGANISARTLYESLGFEVERVDRRLILELS